MRSAIVASTLLFSLISAWSQSPPAVELPSVSHPAIGPHKQITMQGTVVAYDWSTRYYMEGARVENFVFRAKGDATSPKYVRVVLLWHPADKPQILPKDFYSSSAPWQITLRSTSPYNFVRRYCQTLDAPTFVTDAGNGNRVKLQRYVSPAVLPPDIDLAANFVTAVATPPTSPEMPDPRSMQCMYLEKVRPAER